ncbi:MAG: nucleotidyltransferase family protein [Acidipila sp.]|nr:nucleotidyltransferase family protein [Acidipila sp.]
MLAAVILAAGESRRMGQPKALLPYLGGTFLTHLLSCTRHPKIGVTRVVVGAHAEDISRGAGISAEEIIFNKEWARGQLSSIQVAVRALEGLETDGMLLCPVDHPLVTGELVGELIGKFYSSGKMIVVPKYAGRRGHPMIFSSALYAELLAAPEDLGARAVVWAHAADVVEVATEEEGVVLNLNDPETLARALGKR